MKTLFVVPEATPIIKVGGLGDVAGALPKALVQLGHDVRILLPDYAEIDHRRYPSRRQWENLTVPWLGRPMTVRIDVGELPGARVPVYYLVCPELFAQPSVGGVYLEKSAGQNRILEMRRFIFFSWAVAHLLPRISWQPEAVHCHDWTAATLPTWLKFMPAAAGRYSTVLTIHNLQNQGRWPADGIWPWLGIRGHEHPLLERRDGPGYFNALQQGILAADAVNTVSPNYAREILTAEFGEGLAADLRQRPDGISGILNGIDVDVFNPATDRALARTYTSATVVEGKRQNRLALGHRLHLPPDGPLYGFIGRLTPQKGVALLLAVAPQIFQAGGRLAVLGAGWPDLERQLQALGRRWPQQARIVIGFDPILAQLIYAASDFFLMPSQFEPCGLGQMIAMRYGALPIVRDTGGLHDTVVDVVRHPRRGTGLVFQAYTPQALGVVVDESLRLYAQPDTVQTMAVRAMYQDFSWDAAAATYLRLYAQAHHRHTTLRDQS